MAYLQCVGKNDIWGNQAVPSANNQPLHIYRGFRFRDPISIDVGRTKPIIIDMIIVSGTFIDSTGLIWRVHEGDQPAEDPAFVRHPHNKHIDDRSSRWAFGTQCTPKNNPQVSTNEGYLIDSTVKAYKNRGDIGG